MKTIYIGESYVSPMEKKNILSRENKTNEKNITHR
jgi:hypothetical protein